MKLIVAIPTYNRVSHLRRLLPALLPQLDDDCLLRIVDNASAEPVADAIADLLAPLPPGRAETVRNRVNLGLGGNLLRCFELAEDDRWLWMLSDDETVLPDAIATIRRTLEEHPDAAFVNFASEIAPRPAPIKFQGLDEFAERLDSFGNCLLISTGLYRVSTFLPQMRHGYRLGNYGVGPHFAMLLAVLDGGAKGFFSERPVIRYQEGQAYSSIPLALGFMTMLDWPMSPASRRRLAAKINLWPTFKSVVAQLLALALKEGDAENALYFYRQICVRYYYYERSWRVRLRLLAGRCIIRYFRLAHWFFGVRGRLRGRDAPKTNFQFDYSHRL